MGGRKAVILLVFALLLTAIFSRGGPAESGSADTERSAAAKQRNEATGEGVRQPKPESETQRGKRLRDEALEGGYRVPCLYLYSPKTKAFYYNEEYVFHRESEAAARRLSQDRVIAVFLLAEGKPEELSPKEPAAYWNRSDSGFAIYFKRKFTTDYVFDEVIGGNRIALVKQNQKHALFGGDGEPQTDFVYNGVAQIAENYAAVRNGEFWGFADLSGEEIIPVVFDDAVVIDGDAAFVKVREKHGILVSRKPPPD